MENVYNVRGLNRRIYYIGAARFIRATGRASSFIFLPLVFIQVYGMSFILTGVVVGFATLIMALVQMYSGKLTDRIGRRFFMIMIPVPNIAAFFVMFLSVQYVLPVYVLITSLYVTTLINALQYPALQAAVADLSRPEHRMSAYAMVRIMTNIGAAFGPLIGGFLAGIGFQYVFLLASLATALEILILYRAVPETYNPQSQAAKSEDMQGIRSALGNRFFLAFIFAGIAFAFFLSQNNTSLSVYAVVLEKIPLLYLGFLFAINGSLVAILQFPMLRLMTAHSHAITWRGVGVIFYASAFVILSLSPVFIVIIIYMFISTIGENFISPTTQTIVTTIAPPKLRGTYIGTYSFFTSFGRFFGSFLGLFILSLFSSIPSEFWLWIALGTYLVSLSYFAMGHSLRQKGTARTKTSEN